MDTTVSEPRESEEEIAHLKAIESAIIERGTLDHTLVHGVFVGPPRSGKDSVMKRLLGEHVSDLSPSTEAVENVVHVKVEESCTFAATIGPSNWIRLAYDDEALHLMKEIANNPSTNRPLQEEKSDDIQRIDPPVSIVANGVPSTVSDKSGLTGHDDVITLNIQSEIVTPALICGQRDLENTTNQVHDTVVSEHKSPLKMFKEAIKSGGLERFSKILSQQWSLYLTNTGGQIEFQEILPLLVSGPSIFFITFSLHQDIEKSFSVEYQLQSGESSKSYQSSLSVLDSILQTLSSIAAMGSFVYKGLQKKCVPLKPKVFLIGTHKDLLDENTKDTVIKGIDHILQRVIKSTSHYREGIIRFCSESQMIFTVSNFDQSDLDFQNIRSAVEHVVRIGEYRMVCPTHWLIYSFVVRQFVKRRIISYDECLAVAKMCGIKDRKEFNEVLHFIHTKMGLIRHFSHGELKEFVIINPQVLFEKITELIVETFTFEKCINRSSMETFKNMGIFTLSDFKRISDQSDRYLTPTMFAKLLKHLRIAAEFEQDGETKYFLPCALAHAKIKEHDPTSTVPPLIVTFRCGYCPKGLFGTLISYLINDEMLSDFEWELDTEMICRDEVSFQVGPYDIVTLKILSTHLQISCCESNPKLPRKHCRKECVCQEILQSVQKGIMNITREINYMNAQHSFTFYCTSDTEKCSRYPHPAKLMKHRDQLCSLKCASLKKCFPLPPGYEIWQLDSSSPPVEATVNTLRLTDPCTKLEKEHLSSLYRQLSEHASKWKEIGTYLGFHGGELSNIEAKPSLHHESPKGFLLELLSEFLEWAPGDSRGSKEYATLGALKEAVRDAGLGKMAAELAIDVILPVDAATTSRTHASGKT